MTPARARTQTSVSGVQHTNHNLRLVFTNNGVGVVIRSAEQYDLVKIKPTESEEEYRCHLRLQCLKSVKNTLLES